MANYFFYVLQKAACVLQKQTRNYLLLKPIEANHTLRRSPLTNYLLANLMVNVHILQLLDTIRGQEKRLVLPALLVHLPAGVQVQRGVVHAPAAADQQHLVLLHEEEDPDAGTAAARVQCALSRRALEHGVLCGLVACSADINKISVSKCLKNIHTPPRRRCKDNKNTVLALLLSLTSVQHPAADQADRGVLHGLLVASISGELDLNYRGKQKSERILLKSECI